MLDSPILLMCSERSGSNLLAKVFDAHPHVVAPGAAHLFRIFSGLEAHYRGRGEALASDLLEMFSVKFGAWAADQEPVARLKAEISRHGDAPSMIAALLDLERRLSGKTWIFLKEVQIHAYLPFILRVARRPRFVFMVRDPRDMALSWRQAPAMRGGVVRAAAQWLADQRGFAAMRRSLGADIPVAFLTYESLVTRGGEVLPRICLELGLDFDPAMLAFERHSRSAVEEASRAKMLENIAKPFLPDRAGRFRQGLDEAEIAYVEAVCGPMMGEFGYDRVAGEDLAGSAGWAALEAEMKAREPWEKPEFQALPEAERERYRRWSATRARLLDAAGPGLP